jgi:GT2 family glycosyltransferase
MNCPLQPPIGQDRPLVSVVIPHYEDVANLRQCLDLLDQQTLPRALWEIIVSDNRSPSGMAIVEQAVGGRAVLVISHEKGAGPTRNVGAAIARGSVLAFLDSDCRPAPDWLEKGTAASASSAVTGGRINVLVRDDARLTPSEAFERVFAFNNKLYIQEKGFSVSANLFIRREAWDRVGGFKAAISEDVDWCWRARDAGFPVRYADDVVVGHGARVSFFELKRKWRRLTLEAYYLGGSGPVAKVRWLARTWLLLLSPLAHTPKVLSSNQLHTASDRLKALTVLFAIRWYRFFEGHRILLANSKRAS